MALTPCPEGAAQDVAAPGAAAPGEAAPESAAGSPRRQTESRTAFRAGASEAARGQPTGRSVLKRYQR